MYKFIKKLYNKFVIAEIAPTVEQLSRNQWVAGSNPVFSTNDVFVRTNKTDRKNHSSSWMIFFFAQKTSSNILKRKDGA